MIHRRAFLKGMLASLGSLLSATLANAIPIPAPLVRTAKCLPGWEIPWEIPWSIAPDPFLGDKVYLPIAAVAAEE